MSFISTKLSLSFEINKHHEGKIHIEQFLARTASRETKTHHHHDGGPGRGKLTLRLLGGGESIAHCKSLDFTFLPFTFLPFEGREDGPGRGSSELRVKTLLTVSLPIFPWGRMTCRI